MKKYIYPILSAIVGALLFGISGLLIFMKYGAKDCDMPGKICDCFCCNSFGLRGYESCGNYGILLGSSVGMILGIIVYLLIKNKHHHILHK